MFHHHKEVEAPGEIVKIFCEANPEYYLTAKEDDAVLAVGDESNPYQQWIVDATWGLRVKDRAGFPAFALINKATRHALRHGKEENEKVHTCPYSKDELNEVVLWTESDDVGNGYKCIRPVDNTDLNLDAKHGDPESGGIQDGTDLILFKWKKQENGNQKWKILPIYHTVYESTTMFHHHKEVEAPGEIVKIFCEANPEYYLTAKEDDVVLAVGDESNPYQQWIVDATWGLRVKDRAGFPALALINKATRHALRHGKEENEKVHTCPYSKDELNEVVLWTESDDVGNGYKCIRPVDNTDLNLDAKHGDPESGGIQDGTDLILFKWKKQENGNQKWKILPISLNPISQVQKHEAEDAPYGESVPKYGRAKYTEDVPSYGGALHGENVSNYGGAPHGEGVLSYGNAPYGEGVPNYVGAPSGEGTDKVTNYEGPAYAVHTHHHHHDFPQHIPEGQIVTIYCEQSPEYFLSVRDGEVVLAPGDADDVSQHWIKVDEWGNKIRDEVGFPAFALVNKATLKALKHGSQEWDRVELSYYNENDLDESILWTQSADVGRGYQCIRPVGNIHLNLDAKLADGKHGNVEDGNELILFSWKKQKNQKWKMLPVD